MLTSVGYFYDFPMPAEAGNCKIIFLDSGCIFETFLSDSGLAFSVVFGIFFAFLQYVVLAACFFLVVLLDVSCILRCSANCVVSTISLDIVSLQDLTT